MEPRIPIKKKRLKRSVRRKGKTEDSNVYESLEKEANTNVIKYVLKQITINVTGEEPNDYAIDEAASVILNITDLIQEVGT
nr:unnamed protein product [Callosobruchus analis]